MDEDTRDTAGTEETESETGRFGRAREFVGSKYNANYRVGYHDGQNPFVQSKYGPVVTTDTQASIDTAKARISSPEGSPFTGPVIAQDGSTLVAAGVTPDYATIESTMNKFVQGVVGDIPQSSN